jgi:hypothetical protein
MQVRAPHSIGEENQPVTAAINPPLPAGAEPDNWWEDDPQDFRVVYGVSRGVEDHDLIVQTSALQYPDGSINTSDDPPRVSLDIHYDSGLSSVQARELASVLIECADEIDGWAGR